jgi:protein tyrosine/serine phosphatase
VAVDRALGDRWIEFEGAFNVRDLGGLSTAAGGSVRRGRVFRADGPRRLTTADRQKVVALGIRHAIDLRTGPEMEHGTWAAPGIAAHHFAVIDSIPDLSKTESAPQVPKLDTVEAFAGRYVFRIEGLPDRYAEAVGTAMDVAAEGVLFHCAAGKDRTGMVAAALLEALEVPRESIAADYGLSAEGMRRKIAAEARDPLPGDTRYELLPELVKAPSAAERSRFLELMDERHGGLLAFLRANGLAEERIRAFRDLMLD